MKLLRFIFILLLLSCDGQTKNKIGDFSISDILRYYENTCEGATFSKTTRYIPVINSDQILNLTYENNGLSLLVTLEDTVNLNTKPNFMNIIISTNQPYQGKIKTQLNLDIDKYIRTLLSYYFSTEDINNISNYPEPESHPGTNSSNTIGIYQKLVENKEYCIRRLVFYFRNEPKDVPHITYQIMLIEKEHYNRFEKKIKDNQGLLDDINIVSDN